MGIPILAFLATPQHSDMKNKKTAAGLSVLIASALLLVPALKKEKDPCRVDLGTPHISTHLAEREGLAAVKVNAFSICNRPHSRVTLTVELWKEETIFKKRLRKTVTRNRGLIPPNEKFKNENTFVPCRDNSETLYFAKAYGKALIDGVWHFAADKSEISIPIKCGT
jgi:hypothetical protein